MNICDRYYLNPACPIFDAYLLVIVIGTNPTFVFVCDAIYIRLCYNTI